MKRLIFMLLTLAAFTGCTSAPSQPAAQADPPQLLTGRSAFQQTFIAAHTWAADVRPYELQSIAFANANGRDGKAVIWGASFASGSLNKSKPFSWSGIDSPDAPSRGVSPGTEDSYVPNNAFDIQFLKVDSDKAFEVAEQHGGDKILQDNPKLPVTYLLDWNRTGGNLIWHVIYGSSRSDAKQVIDVDATTGVFIRRENS